MTPRARLTAAICVTTLLGCASQQQSTPVVNGLQVVEGDAPFVTSEGEASYHMLMAEIALERGEWEVSASEYRRAAMLSDDPATAERAARVAYDHGRLDDAHASALRWRALAPQSATARNMLIALEVKRGDGAAAKALLDELIDEAEREGWLNDGISMAAALLSVEGAWDTALPLMRRIVQRHDELPEAQIALANLALRAGRPAAALAPARRAVALDPAWLHAHTLLAGVLLELGRVDEALAAASAAASLPNAGPEFRLRHAMLLLSAGRDDDARAMLAALLAEDPGMVGALRQAGLLALREGRLEDARDHFRRMLAAGAQQDALFLLGRTEDLAGNTLRAVHLYGQIQDGEFLVPAQVRQAELLVELGRDEEAVEGLRYQQELHPQFQRELLEARATLLGRIGRGDEAVALYDEALARWPDAQSLRFGRAYLLESLDRVDEAIAEMERLVERYPDDANALNALGYTLADRTDRYREAARYIGRALALEPDNPAIIDSMGWVEYRRGRHARALAHLERAWSMLRDPEIAAHLGEVLWIMGRREEAAAVWREALDSFPGDDGLAEVMARFAD